MGVLQFQLQGGKNYVKLHKAIASTNVILESVTIHMNVETHGYYLARVRFPPHVVNTMNARNSLYDNTELIIPIDHTSSYTMYQPRWDLGNIAFPSSMEIDVDLDQGIQVVPRKNVGYDGIPSYNPNTGVWSPTITDPPNGNAGATGDNTITTQSGFGTTYTKQSCISGTTLKPNNAFVSVGLLADKIADKTTGNGTTSGQYLNDTTGKVEGFIPFMYSMILSFEYDGTSTEARVQSMY